MTNNVHEVIEVEPFTALSVGAEEAEEVPDGGDVEEEDEDDHVEGEAEEVPDVVTIIIPYASDFQPQKAATSAIGFGKLSK
ncbi:hypothetical protein P8452_46775 [Trifolium repens]|nr:hypothetical protein P8452_46775 [Trifolium repens]